MYANSGPSSVGCRVYCCPAAAACGGRAAAAGLLASYSQHFNQGPSCFCAAYEPPKEAPPNEGPRQRKVDTKGFRRGVEGAAARGWRNPVVAKEIQAVEKDVVGAPRNGAVRVGPCKHHQQHHFLENRGKLVVGLGHSLNKKSCAVSL